MKESGVLFRTCSTVKKVIERPCFKCRQSSTGNRLNGTGKKAKVVTIIGGWVRRKSTRSDDVWKQIVGQRVRCDFPLDRPFYLSHSFRFPPEHSRREETRVERIPSGFNCACTRAPLFSTRLIQSPFAIAQRALFKNFCSRRAHQRRSNRVSRAPSRSGLGAQKLGGLVCQSRDAEKNPINHR